MKITSTYDIIICIYLFFKHRKKKDMVLKKLLRILPKKEIIENSRYTPNNDFDFTCRNCKLYTIKHHCLLRNVIF